MASTPDDASEIWALVERALEHYGAARLDAATADMSEAVRRAPDDLRLGQMLDWLRRRPAAPPAIFVVPLGGSGAAAYAGLDENFRHDTQPVEEIGISLRRTSAVHQVANLSDNFDEHGRPQITPVPALVPMQPAAEERLPPEVTTSNAVPEVEIFAEPTRSLPLDRPIPAAARRTSDRMPPHDEFRATPSRNSRNQGTLLGVQGPSFVHTLLDDPTPTPPRRATDQQLEQAKRTPVRGSGGPDVSLETRDAVPEREFGPQLSPPRGTQFLHRVAPEDKTATRSRPDAAVVRQPSQPQQRRTPSDKRTNPYLRQGGDDISQAFLDLQMAVESSAALEAFELAERAIDVAQDHRLDEGQQAMLVLAYELAIGPLDQPVRHGAAPTSLDPRTAFLLSRIDGMMSVDELLEISGMPRFEALRLLAQLVRQGVVEF